METGRTKTFLSLEATKAWWYYGKYRTLEEALEGLPELPEGVEENDVSLIPFFNQRSISSEDALVLLGNLNDRDVNPDLVELEAVSFTVYFGTFEQPQGRSLMEKVDQPLSFEVLPTYEFAYSAWVFGSLDKAEEYAEDLRTQGWDGAEVNKFLNGERVAMLVEQELYAFVIWKDRRNILF